MAPHSNTLLMSNNSNTTNHQSSSTNNSVIAATTSKHQIIEFPQTSDSIYNHNPYDIYFNTNNSNNFNFNNSVLSPVSSNSGLDFINISTNIEDISVLDMDINTIGALDWTQPQQQQQYNEQHYYPNYYEQANTSNQQQQIIYQNNDTFPQLSTSAIIKNEPLYFDEDSIPATTSVELNSSSSRTKQRKGVKSRKSTNELHYGPVVVRPRRNPAPTLSSGRKSKYIPLPHDESYKREQRRQRNRQAAEKCKQKRLKIEDELNLTVQSLKDKQMYLLKEQSELKLQKQQLENLFQNHNCNINNLYNNNNNNNNSRTNGVVDVNYYQQQYHKINNNQYQGNNNQFNDLFTFNN